MILRGLEEGREREGDVWFLSQDRGTGSKMRDVGGDGRG